MANTEAAEGKGTVIQITADGHLLCTKELPEKVDYQQGFNISHRPEWGRTTIGYGSFEGEKENPVLKELREFLKRPGWQVKMVSISLLEWKAEVVLVSEDVEVKDIKDLSGLRSVVDGKEFTDFQSIIELLGYLQYLFAVSPIAPTASGRA